MKRKGTVLPFLICLLLVGAFLRPAAGQAQDKGLTFGVLLVGPYNDHGWSQAHYEAGVEIEKKVPGSKMIYIDKVNPADRQGVTIPQLVDDLVSKGARLVIANSDDMKDGIREAALQHPQVYFLHVSGDDVVTGKAPKNLANLMGKMEYGKMMAGFAAALKTKTGKIGYLGPLINEETRRLAASSYLGARYAWEKILKKPASELKFQVTWIGFWFNIPGVTSDPTQVMQNFFDSGHDVVISGIDTPEALVMARQRAQQGRTVYAVPYDYKGACEGAGEVCLGVPYYNWVPGYLHFVQAVQKGEWKQEWLWLGPEWKDMNDPEKSSIGFVDGPALAPDEVGKLKQFAADMAGGKVELFRGPLNYQDGSVFLKDGETADDTQIWNLKQLLQGMEGQSSGK